MPAFHKSYPHRIAERLDAALSDATCAGATTGHAEASQPTDIGPNPPQLSQVDGHTDLVTVSLGINDANFSAFLTQCVALAAQDPTGAPCRASYQTEQGDATMAAVAAIRPRVEGVLHLVHARAPRARVLLIGYPQIVPASGTCADLPFATGDYAYVRQYFVAVDAALSAAAKHAKVDYLSLLAPSAGHDACAGDDQAWVIGNRTSARASTFHPYGREQRAIARLVVDALG